MAARCPVCKKPIAARAENPSYPFCSPRCRAIDLGKWLGEEYRIGQADEEREDEAPPAAPGAEHPDDER